MSMTPEVEQRHDDLQKTIDKLSNGHRGDPLAMSEGIVNISKTLQVMLKMNFVTEEKCNTEHDKIIETLGKHTFGWKQLAAVLMACSVFFGLGMHLINTVWDVNPPKAEVIIHTPAVPVMMDDSNVVVQ